ncbi:TetR/AcrR family transcriptional regulator [Leifsonia poae]|uniref:TetR family transcriptional regulator n=1 Tax=Leifsonia poae TaxID=110933 RepID=A0A9W6HCG1_9MICO|nr:TetR family transcriptional regulator [Leifsonia poae]GLJ77228.1 TetR family transcriptional regulator [Leifsonia poae]
MTASSEVQSPETICVPGLRERKKQETRTAIHEAAVRLVAENGVAATSVDAICSEAVVSSRTFFNYFPSKMAAIIGHDEASVTDAQREAFLAGTGDDDLVRDLCTLLAGITDSVTRRGRDRQKVRELIARRPEVVPELLVIVTEMRSQLVELAELRTTPAHARFAVALVIAALMCALDEPLDPRIDEFGDWLFSAVMSMRDIANAST